MSKILIVTDSTSGMDVASAKQHNIEMVSLSVIIDGVEYKDHIDIQKDELICKLKEGAVPTTSQPNIGYVKELMRAWRDENYDAIIIITISSYLSGTCQGFHMMKEELQMDNVHIVDTKTVAGPMIDGALYARKMADEGKSVAEILVGLARKFENTSSFLYPETLQQLKKGGRISPVAANMASLLKIKPLLMLKKDGTIIDKYGMSRTENKIFEMIVSYLKEEGVSADTHVLYIPHAQALDTVHRFVAYASEQLENMEMVISDLPAVLTSHAGLGSIAVQSVSK